MAPPGKGIRLAEDDIYEATAGDINQATASTATEHGAIGFVWLERSGNRLERGERPEDPLAQPKGPCRDVDTARMPAEGSLKRLGGGRWETRDGRFTIEPQSGTWVVVDNTETDDLGLPLVRGPFGSLTAAKEAIEGARDSGPIESPLAERLKQAGTGKGAAATPARRSSPAAKPARDREASSPSTADVVPAPAAPEEAKWLREMSPPDRRRARELIGRLADLDVADPEGVARAELARDQPAVARLALERAIRQAIASASDPASAGRAVADAILRGRDKALDVRWQIVDDRGRRIEELDLSE